MVNLSLGSDNGFANDDSAASVVYRRLNDAGILFMTSAGNAGYSSVNNNYEGNTLTSDPEISMVSSPSIYSSNLCVASMENTVQDVYKRQVQMSTCCLGDNLCITI